LVIAPPPRSTLFPYTTLFRSGRIRHARALELAGLEEAPHENPEVALDCSEIVLVAHDMRIFRPATGAAIAPGVQREKGDLRRRRSEEHTSELQSRENLVCRLL